MVSPDVVHKIRQEYPEPEESSIYSGEGTYCVGGAVCKFYGMEEMDGFPEDFELAGALKKINPALSLEEAKDYASEIVVLNDNGEFNRAWGVVRKALQDTEWG